MVEGESREAGGGRDQNLAFLVDSVLIHFVFHFA